MRAVLLSSVFLAALPAYAGDLAIYGGAALGFTANGNNATKRDLSGYVEGELSNFHLGVSADIYNDSNADHVGLSFGYRNTLDNGLAYDASYTRELYPNNGGDCCGYLDLNLRMPIGSVLTGEFDTSYYPNASLADAHVSLEYLLDDKVTLSAKLGLAQNNGFRDTHEWELSARYALGAASAVSLHYYDANNYKPFLGLDLTWDTTLFGGSGNPRDHNISSSDHKIMNLRPILDKPGF